MSMNELSFQLHGDDSSLASFSCLELNEGLRQENQSETNCVVPGTGIEPVRSFRIPGF